MTRNTLSPSDGSVAEQRAAERPSVAFEAAQRDLFEAVGHDVRSQFVELDEPHVRTHVLEAGPPVDDGDAPLVFVHGTAAFGAFVAPLVAQFDDVSAVAFDRPGFGLSGEFVYTEANLRPTVVGALGGVLDGLGLGRVDLVGHSMGATRPSCTGSPTPSGSVDSPWSAASRRSRAPVHRSRSG